MADDWRRSGTRQVIGQAELLPIAVARKTWADRLRGKGVINFIDNDAARLGVLRGYSPVAASAELITAIWNLDCDLGAFTWHARDASFSNPGDGASRLAHAELAQQGAKRAEPVWPTVGATHR